VSRAEPAPLRLLRPSELTDAERRYGHAPTPDPTVVYQPEVVIIEGGAQAVRGLGADGLGCSINARAANAADVRPGRVALVTSRCVGRVFAVRKQGDQLALTLGPVEITDIVRDGSFQLDQPIDFDDTLVFEAPEWPGASVPLDPLLPFAGGPVQQGPFIPHEWSSSAARLVPASYGLPAFDVRSRPSFVRIASEDPVGRDAPIVGKNMLGTWMPLSENGVQFLGHATLHLAAPRLNFVLQIRNAKVTRCELEFHGAAGLTMGFRASSQAGGNVNVLRDLPVDVTIPIGGPVPFSVLVHQSYMVQTAFTAANSFITELGDYKFQGMFGLGYRDGAWKVDGPERFSIKQSPLTSLNGVSLGVTGLVLTHQVKVMVGIGAFGFATGPYTALTSSIAVTRGSDAEGVPWGGSPTLRGLVRCKQASLNMTMAVGVGYMIPQPVTKAINFVLSTLNIQHRIGSSGGLQTQPRGVVNSRAWEPDLPVCKLI